jgi:hypothetical protein
MLKISKHSFIAMGLLTILFVSVAYAFFLPSGHAESISSTQRTTSIVGVLGINATAYTTELNSQNNSLLNGLPQSKVDFYLISNQSSVRISSSFVNNTLNLLYMTDYTGTLAKALPSSSTASLAKDFLGKYQAYTSDSFYGMLASTLDNVTGTANVTKSTGDLTLKVVNSNQSAVDYVWTYTDANGICAQFKDVVLSYEQGRLKCFLNNWPLYKIADQPSISKEQAITIALSAAQNFTYKLSNGNVTSTVSMTNFIVDPKSLSQVTLSYNNCPNESLARNNDPFTLYPTWYVPLGSDELYPGDVTGLSVVVWADTGRVASINTMTADYPLANSKSTVAPNALSLNAVVLSASLAIGATLTIGMMLFAANRFPKVGGRRLFGAPFWAILLCAVMLLGMAISTVSATTYSSRIYGSLDGTPGYPPGSPPQTQDEKDAYYDVSAQMLGYFEQNGHFDTSCYTPTKQQVIGDIQYDESFYDRAMVFQFGHMAGYGVGYVDNDGGHIMYSDISPYTGAGKYDFVFLWVCAQAYGGPSNQIVQAYFPYSNLRPDGYGLSADGSKKCFIGFDGFSPEIGNWGVTFGNQWTYPAEYFINDFYAYAVLDGYSISDSLNQASLAYFGTTYYSCILYSGYQAWYSGDQSGDPAGYYSGRMCVFGDGSMTFLQGYLTVSYDPNEGYTSVGNGWQNYNGVQVMAYTQPGWYFDHWVLDGNQVIYGNPINLGMTQDHTLQAVFTNTPVYCTLTFNALDTGNRQLYPNIYVDNQWVGTGYTSVQVTQGWHYIYVDDPTWNDFYQTDSMFIFFSDMGNNGDYHYISSDSTITAYYYP